MGVKKNIMEYKIPVSISLEEILALKVMCNGGRLFTADKEKDKVRGFFKTIGNKLLKLGMPQSAVDKVVNV